MTEKPNWAASHHLTGTDQKRLSHCCAEPLEVEEERHLASWHGVNWEDGYEEIVRCPNCNKRGQLTTKLMNERTGRTRTSALGSAAIPREETAKELSW